VGVEVVDAEGLAQAFDELTLDEQQRVHDLLEAAEAALRPFKCAADVKKFLPKELPAMYTADREGRFLRSLEQSKEIANPLWASVLNSVARRERHSAPHAQLCFNYHNPLIRRLATVSDQPLLARSVQMLYIQALLLGHHPLSSKEMALLNDGLLALIEQGLRGSE
jgi:molecular chaperone HtpG